ACLVCDGDRPVVAIAACYVGSADGAEATAAPLRKWGTIVADQLQPMSYVQLQSLFDAARPAGRCCAMRSNFMAALPDAALEILLEGSRTTPSPPVTFYERLGLTKAYRNDRGVMMAAGTVQLFLFQVRRPDPAPVGRELGLFGNPPGIDHISFAVTDIDALYAKLCKAGVVLAGPPEDQSWGARMVGLKDPDGNNLYLLQPL